MNSCEVIMNENEKKKPPYVTIGPTNKFLDLLRRQTPSKVDSKYVVDNDITTPPNAWTIVRFAEWLGFITDTGEIVQEKVRVLKLSGPERDQQMAKIVEDAYKDLFDVIDVEKASKEDIANFFVNTYNFGHRQKEIATSLFLHLCQLYGIPMAENLKKRTRTKEVKKKSASKIKKVQTAGILEQPTPERSTTFSEGSIERKGVGVEITVRSFGMEANPHTTIVARDKQELEIKLEGEFKAFMEYIKILLKNINEK